MKKRWRNILILFFALIIIAFLFFFVFTQNTVKSIVESRGLEESDLQGRGLVVYKDFDFERKINRTEIISLKEALEGLKNSSSVSKEEKAKAKIFVLGLEHDLKQDVVLRELEINVRDVSENLTENCDKLEKLKESQQKQEQLYLDAIDINIKDLHESNLLGNEVVFLALDMSEDGAILYAIDSAVSTLEIVCQTGGNS